MFDKSFLGIGRTTWIKAALVADPGAEQVAITMKKFHSHPYQTLVNPGAYLFQHWVYSAGYPGTVSLFSGFFAIVAPIVGEIAHC